MKSRNLFAVKAAQKGEKHLTLKLIKNKYERTFFPPQPCNADRYKNGENAIRIESSNGLIIY